MCVEQLGINDLVEAMNKNDRLHLLNDPSVLPGNLDNDIHPIFCRQAFSDPHLKQALRFASLLLQEDRLLEFFIPLTYGRAQIDFSTGKTYLTNPMAGQSDSDIALYIRGVRKALDCLAHCVTFRFITREDHLWGRTLMSDSKPAHSTSCSKAFQKDMSVRIELNGRFRAFYQDKETGYRTRSKCDQFRHDFQFAATIVHELVHAYGIMRRARLNEPWIRLDLPSDEWGYAWENFAFGTIINPQQRKISGTHIQFRKTWSSPTLERQGKEYSTVPVAWTAQWFRKETWERISTAGVLAIPLPVVRAKFVKSTRLRKWVVMTDAAETRHDIKRLHRCNVKERLQSPGFHSQDMQPCRASAIWAFVDSENLQISNVPVTERIPDRFSSYGHNVMHKPALMAASRAKFRKSSLPQLTCITNFPEARWPLAVMTPQLANIGRKRSREDDDEEFSPRKMAKC